MLLALNKFYLLHPAAVGGPWNLDVRMLLSLNKYHLLHPAAVGVRVKYLVDTPETLWGCLDAGDFLQAARRFLQARRHQCIQSTCFRACLLQQTNRKKVTGSLRAFIYAK